MKSDPPPITAADIAKHDEAVAADFQHELDDLLRWLDARADAAKCSADGFGVDIHAERRASFVRRLVAARTETGNAVRASADRLIESAIDSDASGRPDAALYQHAMALRAAFAAWADAQKAPQPRTAEPAANGCPLGCVSACEYEKQGHGFACPLKSAARIQARAQADNYAKECDDADELLRLLGFEPDDARTDGGSINLPKVRSLLAERAAEPAPALSMKRHEWDSLSPEAKRLIHDRTREHTLQSARAAQAIRDTPLAEPAPAPADEPRLPKPYVGEGNPFIRQGGGGPALFTSDQTWEWAGKFRAYWIAKLQAERSKP
jgi:hypothetical protein